MIMPLLLVIDIINTLTSYPASAARYSVVKLLDCFNTIEIMSGVRHILFNIVPMKLFFLVTILQASCRYGLQSRRIFKFYYPSRRFSCVSRSPGKECIRYNLI